MKRRTVKPSALALLAALLLGAAHAQETVLYKASRVEPITGPTLSPGQVLVVDGKIRAIGSRIQAPSGAQVVDLGDGTLMPGLVDAYNDAGLAGGTNEVTREITPGFQAARVIDWKDRRFREALSQGTTSLAISPGTENVVSGLSCVVKTAGRSAESRRVGESTALLISLCSDPTRRNSSRARPDSIYVRQPTNRMGVVWMLRSTFDQVRRGEEIESGEWLASALSGERPMFAVSRTMHDLSTLLTLSEEFELSPVAVGGQEAYQLADRLAAAKVPVVLERLTSHQLQGAERTELVWNLAGRLAKAGVQVSLSGGQLLEQARFAYRFGLSAEEALRAITLTPARTLRLDDRVGSLAVGRDADMLALDGDPLEFTTAIRWVMVNGKIYENQKGDSRGEYDL